VFKDRDEELWRIQQALLAEEPETEEEPEASDEDADFLPEETQIPNGPGVYKNFSNGYGASLRNYASGYRAYNRDKTDDDLDEYSQDVWEGRPKGRLTGLIVAIVLLSLGIVGILAFWAVRYGGIL